MTLTRVTLLIFKGNPSAGVVALAAIVSSTTSCLINALSSCRASNDAPRPPTGSADLCAEEKECRRSRIVSLGFTMFVGSSFLALSFTGES